MHVYCFIRIQIIKGGIQLLMFQSSELAPNILHESRWNLILGCKITTTKYNNLPFLYISVTFPPSHSHYNAFWLFESQTINENMFSISILINVSSNLRLPTLKFVSGFCPKSLGCIQLTSPWKCYHSRRLGHMKRKCPMLLPSSCACPHKESGTLEAGFEDFIDISDAIGVEVVDFLCTPRRHNSGIRWKQW